MKLFASDYDGTLLIHEAVSKENIKAIHAWQQAGNLFGIITGRSMETLREEIMKYQIPFDFLATNNGGFLWDKDMNLLKGVYIDFQKASLLIDYIETLACASYVVNDGINRFKVMVKETLEDKKYHKIQKLYKKEDIINHGKIAQIVISLNDDQLSKTIASYINTHYGDEVIAYVNVYCVDIVPVGISKSVALETMSNQFQVHNEHIYAIGDSYNDLPMLEKYNGFCVENSNDDIKKAVKKTYRDVASCMYDLLKI